MSGSRFSSAIRCWAAGSRLQALGWCDAGDVTVPKKQRITGETRHCPVPPKENRKTNKQGSENPSIRTISMGAFLPFLWEGGVISSQLKNNNYIYWQWVGCNSHPVWPWCSLAMLRRKPCLVLPPFPRLSYGVRTQIRRSFWECRLCRWDTPWFIK